MNLEWKNAVLIASSLLFWCGAICAQTSPYVEIDGESSACSRVIWGPKVGTLDVKQPPVPAKCSLGNSTSGGSADIVDLGPGENAAVTAQNGAGANARAEAVQTLILKPPKGFTGKKVTLSYESFYSWSISGVGPGTGTAKLCIGFAPPGTITCQTEVNNGSGTPKISSTVVVPKSAKGFRLTILEQAYAEAAGNEPAPPVEPTVEVKAGAIAVPTVTLPKGWTCKYDSGNPCP